MIQNRVICDRCGEECGGSTYYTIDIYGHDINPTNDNRVSTDTATQNVYENMSKAFGRRKHYCKKCKEEIAYFCMSEEEKEHERQEDRRKDKCARCNYFMQCVSGLLMGHKCLGE